MEEEDEDEDKDEEEEEEEEERGRGEISPFKLFYVLTLLLQIWICQ